MTGSWGELGGRPTTLVAWTVAAAAASASVAAVAVAPHADIPWDAVSFPLLFGVPGALLAAQAPRRPIGWLMLVIAACFSANAFVAQWLAAGHIGGAAWLAWWAGRASAVLVPATLLLLLLLPDGRLPSVRWLRPVQVVVAVQLAVIAIGCLTPGEAAPDEDLSGAGSLTNPVGVLPDSWHEPLVASIGLVLVLPFLLGAVAAVQRLRHPQDDERARVVSVLVSACVFVLLVTVPDLAWPEAAVWFHIAGTALLCGAVFAAVVRGRMERAQLVVSQGLVYGVLTVVVMAAYVALVGVSAQVGSSESLAGPVTAVVALALLPARGVLQSGLRRAMYGDRGQPQVALRRLSSSFGDSDDLDGVLAGLARSVQASLRARWVEVEFRQGRAAAGDRQDGTRVEERVLDGGDGADGLLRVAFAPGRPLRQDEADLLDDLAAHGARSARVVLLAADLAAARHDLVESREEERSRLRRDLHDELGPVLAGLAMQLGSMPALVTADAALATTRLARLESEARGALEQMRQISRDLRPPTLDELGLVAAIVERGRALGMTVRARDPDPGPLSPAVEVAAYRIASEAVLNAHRHAEVDGVELQIALQAGVLRVEVVDRGPGHRFAQDGVGVPSMRARAAELGGSLEVLDTPGGGTTVRALLPETSCRGGTA